MTKPSITKSVIPFWLKLKGSVAETQKLIDASHELWLKVITWLCLPQTLIDPETAPLELVDDLAWERRITRLDVEPEASYRLRVKHAFANEKDAGSNAGIIRIFERLGIQGVTIEQRLDNFPWDFIRITFTDEQLSEYGVYLLEVIRLYGRTCRRYIFNNDSDAEPIQIQQFSAVNHYYYSIGTIG